MYPHDYGVKHFGIVMHSKHFMKIKINAQPVAWNHSTHNQQYEIKIKLCG